MYLALVIDLYSRKVAGWATSHRLKAALVKEVLSIACFRTKPPRGLFHHSDRGSQYPSAEYQHLLESFGIRCGMSRKGDCCGNAVVESFFHSLKTEWTGDNIYTSRDQARRDVMDYIEMF